jgi:hypothetical protein
MPPGAVCASLALGAASLLLLLGSSLAHAQSPSTHGRWVSEFLMRNPGTSELPEIAVHMAVLRGQSDATHVLYFNHGYSARLMLNAMDGVTALHVNVPSGSQTSPTYVEPFCAGVSSLADGRAFVAGGQFNLRADPTGNTFSMTFDARNYGSSGHGWVNQDPMPSGRFYPTVTTLATGEAMVTQGDEYFQTLQYGGSDASQTVRNTLVPLAGSQRMQWKEVPVRAVSTTQHDRVGHGLVVWNQDELTLFGGRNATTPGMRNLQSTYREDPDDSTQRWVLFDGAIGSVDQPDRRSEHTLVSVGGVLRLFGGLDDTGQPRDDLWMATYSGTWTWTEPLDSGSIPSARYGHTSVHDPAPFTNPRILVFGGRNSSGVVDNAVYALSLWSPMTPVWSVVKAANPDTTQAPAAREGHAAIFDDIDRGDSKRRMLVFGGRDASGSLLNDAWALERNNSTPVTYNWVKLNPLSRPAARADHAAVYEPQRDMLLVMGGDSTTTAGGETGALWGLPLADLGSSSLAWQLVVHDSTPGPRAGQAAAYIPISPMKNRYPEKFNPGAAPGSQWTRLTWAPKLMPLTYPFLFQLPGGKVYWAGPNGICGTSNPYGILNKTFLLEPNPLATDRGWSTNPNLASQGFWGGTSVLYYAGADSAKIMKSGGNHNLEDGCDDATATWAISFAGTQTAGWKKMTATPSLTHRRDHNLTLLPTGEVLATGGAGTGQSAKVQIWNPTTRTWSAELAEEPRVRNYHSTAALLPDGRVLSAGGSKPDDGDAGWGTLYEPPYLFKSDGTLATRPPLSGSPQRVRYGAQFSVCLSSSDSISTVCLIRPAAVTHAFDQNQRYVPVTFTPDSFPATRLVVTAPPDSFQAPPGDYLLFLVNTKGVPSIARWVRMGYSWSEGDVTRPSRITDLTPDFVSNNWVSLYWTAVGDDGNSGTASYADLRRSTSPIDSSNFGSATAVNPQPVPVCAGTTQIHMVTGLSPHTTYYFAVKFSDESGNMSLFGNPVSATTLGQCCIGERAALAREGGYSAGRAGGSEGGGAVSSATGVASSSATVSGGTPLVVEAGPKANGLDLRLRAIGEESFEGRALSGGGGVLLQRLNGPGQWADLVQYDLPPGDRFALPAPDRPTRWVLLEPLALEKVLPEVAGSAAGWILDQASHSREGDVTDALLAGGATPAMTAGDTLTAHYAAAPESAAMGSCLAPRDRSALERRGPHPCNRATAGSECGDTEGIYPASEPAQSVRGDDHDPLRAPGREPGAARGLRSAGAQGPDAGEHLLSAGRASGGVEPPHCGRRPRVSRALLLPDRRGAVSGEEADGDPSLTFIDPPAR